jgi:glucose dehydrogenase
MSDNSRLRGNFDPLEGPVTRFQAQPIVVDGVLYTPSPGGFSVIALDGATGKLKWVVERWNTDGGSRRDVLDRRHTERLLAAFGRYIYSLDPATGRPFTQFWP